MGYKWRLCYSVFHSKKRCCPRWSYIGIFLYYGLWSSFRFDKRYWPIGSFLFIAYVDDSTRNNKTFEEFSWFSELKPNITKCEIAGLVPLKGVLEAVCGLNTAVLTNDPIKILGMHLSHHGETKTERNFLSTVKKHRILSMYGMQEHLL